MRSCAVLGLLHGADNLVLDQAVSGDQRWHVDHASAAVEFGYDLPAANSVVDPGFASSDELTGRTGAGPESFSKWNVHLLSP